MAELPEAAEGFLQTELGMVKYTVNEANHVYLDSRDTAGSGSLLINRVPYSVSMHLYLIDGVWKLKDYNGLWMSRRNSYGRDYTNAAYTKAQEVLIEVWNEFISQNPQLLTTGEVYSLVRELERTDEEIRKYEGELEGAHARRELAMKRLHELGYYGPNKQDWSSRP